MKKTELLKKVEERIIARSITTAVPASGAYMIDTSMEAYIKGKLKQMEQEKTLYELVIVYIKRLKDSRFLFRNGEVNGAAFCRQAIIDKSTWTDLTNGKVQMKKKTLLKLVIALQLNEAEATDFMRRASNSFNPKDMRDQIILALIDLRCYDVEDVYDVLNEYRKNGCDFENIYD